MIEELNKLFIKGNRMNIITIYDSVKYHKDYNGNKTTQYQAILHCENIIIAYFPDYYNAEVFAKEYSITIVKYD